MRISKYLFIITLFIGSFPGILPFPDIDINQLKGRPDGASEYFFNLTKDPALGYPPTERYSTALKITNQLLTGKSTQARIAGVNWTERGPTNVGARTRSILFDPRDMESKKAWAGGVFGGLWHIDDVTNPNDSWQKVNDFMNLAIGAIAFDSLTNTLYVGTGEGWGIVFAGRGDGIYKSVNNGPFLKTTGTVTNDNNAIAEFHEVPKLLITGDHALLASVNGDVHVGLFRSADGGNTWTKVLTGEAGDLEISADKKVIYAGTGRGFNAGKIYKSLDQGLTWTEFTNVPPNGERIEIATSPSDPNRVYLTATSGLDVGWMVSSKDQGASWTGINIPPHINISSCEPAQNDFTRSQGWYDLIMAVHPTNPDIIFAGGVDMHRSLDGGVTWQAVSNWADNCQRYMHADQHAINFRPGHPDQAIFGNDGGVYFSSNLLDSLPYFHMRNKGYNVTQFYSVATDNNAGSNYFLGGTQDNGTRKFVHEGINETTMAFGGDGGFCFIDYNEPKIQIASYIYNSYALSLDSGKTFKDISNDYTHGKFINPSEYDHQQNMLYAGGKADQYFRYTNLTNTVIADSISIGLNGGAVSFLKSSPFTSNRLFIGTDNGQLFIADNTHTTPVPQHISDNGFQGTLNCIETGANDDQLLAVFSNYGVVSVWETLDGGMTWQDKEGNLPDMPIYWALYNPNNRKQVLLATELGMWSTNDITLTSPIWEPTNTDLAHVRCSMIRYRPADGLVAVATYGRGIYTSDIFMGTPTARFEVSNKVAYTGQSIQFTDYSEGAANMYLWDFGDGSTSAIRNPLHAYTSPGTYKTTLSINNGKDIMSDLITVLPDKPVSYKADYGGNFEINPEDFGTETRSGTGFERGVSTVNGKEGTTSGTHAFVTGLTTDYYVENTETYLYTPNFDFTNAGNYSFSFSANHHIRDSIDGFIVEYSLNKSGIWREVIDLSSTNWHNDIHSTAAGAFTPGSGIFSGNSNGYTQYSADVSFLSGNTDVAFRFLFRSVSGGITGPFSGLAIDDIEILAPIYADFTVDTTQTCTENTLTFTDQSGGSATGLISNYAWNFGSGATPATATGPGPHQVSYSTAGIKDIILTLNNTITEYRAAYITIDPIPNQIGFSAPSTEICAGEKATINIENAEKDVVYYLHDTSTGIAIDSITGSGFIAKQTSPMNTPVTLGFTARNAVSGCTSTISGELVFSIKAAPPVPEITADGHGSLIASEGEAYQWYLDSTAVAGATASTLTPTASGLYTVAVSINGCTSVSSAVTFTGLPANESSSVSLYPNPSSNVLHLEIKNSYQGKVHFYVFNTSGQLLIDGDGDKEEEEFARSIDVKGLAGGNYILQINMADSNIIRSFIKRSE